MKDELEFKTGVLSVLIIICALIGFAIWYPKYQVKQKAEEQAFLRYMNHIGAQQRCDSRWQQASDIAEEENFNVTAGDTWECFIQTSDGQLTEGGFLPAYRDAYSDADDLVFVPDAELASKAYWYTKPHSKNTVGVLRDSDWGFSDLHSRGDEIYFRDGR